MEIKILDIDTKTIEAGLVSLKAKKVFEGVRIITYFKSDKDNMEPFLKLTEENEKLKLTSQNHESREEIRLFVSRKGECIKLLASLGYFAISEVKAKRVSYELGSTDFDIDEFPGIQAFLEIDMGTNPSVSLEEILSSLGIENNQRGQMSTPEIVNHYGKNYFELYRLAQ